MTETTPALPVPIREREVSRRAVLLGSAGTLAAGLTAGFLGRGSAAAAAPGASAAPALRTDPFTLGVASGEPTADGVVLWTRLAQDPLAEDGFGGMPASNYDVAWQLATDPSFRHVRRTGTETAGPALGHSVHVELSGLEPQREYFFRFRCGSYLSPVGRTFTAPPAGSSGGSLLMAVASCSNYPAGYFTAYRRIAEDQPDLVLHLGDYIYEGGAQPVNATRPRAHVGPEPLDLAGYRRRLAQYHTDPDLQAAHGIAPWLVVPDDHEVENNYAGDTPEASGQAKGPAFLARRAAAYRAYWENQPLRRSSFPSGPDIQLYRRYSWGRLATFHMLDTRQYRDDQACGDGSKPDCAERLDPARSLPGEQQEQWLIDGLRDSRATWDLISQQVFFAQRDSDPGPAKLLSMDAWDGYVASRDRITAGLRAAAAHRPSFHPVVLTGDVHQHYANDLKADYDDPASATLGEELVATSITSGGDGSDTTASNIAQRQINPHIKFANAQRGYVRLRLDRREARADFRVLPYVSRPGAPASTRASFTMVPDEPGLRPA